MKYPLSLSTCWSSDTTKLYDMAERIIDGLVKSGMAQHDAINLVVEFQDTSFNQGITEESWNHTDSE